MSVESTTLRRFVRNLAHAAFRTGASTDAAHEPPVSSISGLVIAVGPIGTALLTLTGTNPDGTVVTIVQTINVVTSFANDIVIVFGTPIPIPAPSAVFGMPMAIPPTAPSTE